MIPPVSINPPCSRQLSWINAPQFEHFFPFVSVTSPRHSSHGPLSVDSSPIPMRCGNEALLVIYEILIDGMTRSISKLKLPRAPTSFGSPLRSDCRSVASWEGLKPPSGRTAPLRAPSSTLIPSKCGLDFTRTGLLLRSETEVPKARVEDSP